MKQVFVVVFCIALAASACKKSSDSPSTPVNPAGTLQEGISCMINGIAFASGTGAPDAGVSYQSGSLHSITVFGKKDSVELNLYIQASLHDTGAFSIPTKARIVYLKSGSMIIPTEDAGVVTITRNDSTMIKGTFNGTFLLRDSSVINFTNGTFLFK